MQCSVLPTMFFSSINIKDCTSEIINNFKAIYIASKNVIDFSEIDCIFFLIFTDECIYSFGQGKRHGGFG